MIRRSLPVAVLAIFVSLVVHMLGVGWRVAEHEDRAAPEAAPAVPDVGGGFEELAEPLPESPAPEQAEAPPPPEVTEPDASPTTQAQVASDNPQNVTAPDAAAGEANQAETSAGEEAEDTAREAGEDAETSDIAVLTPVTPDVVPQAPEGVNDGAADPADEAIEPEEPDAATPQETEQAALTPVPEAPDNVIEAQEPDVTASAVARSLRPPKTRPTAEQLGVPEQRQAQASRAPRYESPLTAYKRDGTDLLALGRIGNAKPGGIEFGGSGGSGNAGTTNYAGRVLMKLNSMPRVNDRAKGVARVYFQINPNGTLAWVRIIDSSGSADIRSAAQEQVRRAAPFPRPPGGKPEKMVFVYRHR